MTVNVCIDRLTIDKTNLLIGKLQSLTLAHQPQALL